MIRLQATMGDALIILDEVRMQIIQRLGQHGTGVFISPHECLGAIIEEYNELLDAIQKNDDKHTRAELLDIAVAAVWGIVSMDRIEEENEQ